MPELRGFRFLDSWFQVPNFVVSGTEHQKFIKPGRGLRRFVHGVTLLNTDSNPTNTRHEETRFAEEDQRKQDGRKRAGFYRSDAILFPSSLNTPKNTAIRTPQIRLTRAIAQRSVLTYTGRAKLA